MTTQTETEATSVDLHPPRLAERFVQLETDQFCDCGYNLHGQIVIRDERLGFMVVRCPECARFHPAGHGVTARTVWLARLGVGALMFWILWLSGFFLFAGFLLGVFQTIGVTEMTTVDTFTLDGRPVASSWNPNTSTSVVTVKETGETVDPKDVTLRRVRKPWSEIWRRDREEYSVLLVVTVLTALVAGVVAAAVTWHIRRRWLLLWLLLPMAAGAVACLLTMLFETYADSFMLWYPVAFGTATAVECAAMGVGLLFGRPVVRALATLFVPPKPRQALAFMWLGDGLKPPRSRGTP